MSRCLKGVLSSLFIALFLAFVQPATAESVAPPSRIALVERVIATAEAAVADPRWVSGSQWEAFKNRIRDPDLQALETDEFVSAFNSAAGALPFSHFRLHWQPESGGPEAAETSIVLTWPGEDIALVRMRAFEGDPAIVTQTMREVVAAQPRALIIDLRGTPGGSFPTAVALSQGIRSEPIDAGAFLTRAWYARYGTLPNEEQYSKIKPLEVAELSGFVEQLRRDGAARLVLPGHKKPVYEGPVIILVDGGTASTCEPFVHLTQQLGAVVIGETTAGAMLSGEYFPMDESFRIFLPVADYVTPDLQRLDGRGVTPDIEVPPQQALERALTEIESSS
ncbi:MAG TPA: S41 family peptidase [Wenzhouxiangella sp.]|nr:S41 family peptidase [Wenzhouxiangella sp.]